MHSFQLALRLRQHEVRQRTARWAGARRFLEVGDALVAIDAEATGADLLSNPNQVAFLGCTQRVGPASLDLVVRTFRRAQVPRFFFWLYPCPQFRELRRWLAERGFIRVGDGQHPLLARRTLVDALPVAAFEVRQVGPWEAAAQQDQLGAMYADDVAVARFRDTVGQPDFHHFMAFDGDEAVGAAVLWVGEDLGYLTSAVTLPDYQKRGAHSALIRARVNKAAWLRCSWAAAAPPVNAQGNLERQGFSVLFDRELYMWTEEAS